MALDRKMIKNDGIEKDAGGSSSFWFLKVGNDLICFILVHTIV
jgi:hypothetical protein